MSTENEGTVVPPAPSAPPVPVETPATSATPGSAAPGAPGQGSAGATAHPQGDHVTAQHGQAAHEQSAFGQAAGTGAYGAAYQHADAAHGGTPGQGAPESHGGAAGHGSAAAGEWPPPPPTVPSYAGGGGSGWGSSYQPPQPKPGGRRGGLVAAVLAAALLAGGVGGGVGYWAAERNDTASSTTVSVSDTPSDLKRDPASVAGIAAAALPSVVTIEATAGDGEGGTGTGFVYDTQGHILTNNHVVASAADGGKLSATFSDGKKYAAEVIGRAQGYDVAVIKLKNAPDDLKPLPLADSDKVAVGDATIAIGAPFGLSNTVTTGIVSAKNRPVASSDGTGTSKASYMSALQTDASINPGNSGGPLLNARGAVIGINSAIQSASNGLDGGGQAGSIGLGFAIPINQAKNVANQLIKTGEPVYPVIGASVSLEEDGGGAKITDEGANGADPVTPGGPADKAGLKPGDVITKLDDTVIDSGPTLIGEIWTHQPGDTVKITFKRDGKEQTVDVVLGERKGDS
ncbi:trypsin-like peptidase domain-containing protein [Streptomyces sp. PSKA54]|uniref:Trypsin-like peptidase domain-containing protein n=1 Tax=Streptomyces himalayensis subsp. aureolus TaxID=2758039 RepID=A0A7W2D1K1_9ACTN|nr:trypsin-like peptidase domain-containing protein [Streptomyces himalayensis]MBA4863003.1 trypsin-like peptidase domain-containing protein [Streptomyces himalayensis subsp. aureolus]